MGEHETTCTACARRAADRVEEERRAMTDVPDFAPWLVVAATEIAPVPVYESLRWWQRARGVQPRRIAWETGPVDRSTVKVRAEWRPINRGGVEEER